jgi:glycosyltransferase involved in cell wall biosynthesis
LNQTSLPLQGSKLRVGFCLHSMNVAGAEVLVTKIIESLRAEIEPTIFCLDSVGKLGEELVAQGIPLINLERKPGLDLSVAKRMANELRTRRIELVHAHQYTPFFYTALARLRGARRTKILMTEHGRHYPDVVSWKRRWINRMVLSKLADHSTACCAFSARALEQNDGFRNVEVLYNGIDASEHPVRRSEQERQSLRLKLGLRPERTYVTCIARFHPVKDHETLLRGFAILHSQVPQTSLILVGAGEREAALRGLAQQLGLGQSVEFWGIRRDISDILQACDIFSLTSVSEAASLTLLEAMANGCPVAITEVGGNPEHITHGVHGLLSKRADPQGLAENLMKLAMDPIGSAKLASAARERVASDFQIGRAVARYSELYRQFGQNKSK